MSKTISDAIEEQEKKIYAISYAVLVLKSVSLPAYTDSDALSLLDTLREQAKSALNTLKDADLVFLED